MQIYAVHLFWVTLDVTIQLLTDLQLVHFKLEFESDYTNFFFFELFMCCVVVVVVVSLICNGSDVTQYMH